MEYTKMSRAHRFARKLIFTVFSMAVVFVCLLAIPSAVSSGADSDWVAINTQFPALTNPPSMWKFERITTKTELDSTVKNASNKSNTVLLLANTPLKLKHLNEISDKNLWIFRITGQANPYNANVMVNFDSLKKYGFLKNDIFYTTTNYDLPNIQYSSNFSTYDEKADDNDGPSSYGMVNSDFYKVYGRKNNQVQYDWALTLYPNSCKIIIGPTNQIANDVRFTFMDSYEGTVDVSYPNLISTISNISYDLYDNGWVYDKIYGSAHVSFYSADQGYFLWSDTHLTNYENHLVSVNNGALMAATNYGSWYDNNNNYNYYVWIGQPCTSIRGTNKNSYVKSGETITIGANECAIIKEDTVLDVCEGATLIVKGELIVSGVLKNYGSVVVEDGGVIVTSAGSKNQGYIWNYGAEYLSKNPSHNHSHTTTQDKAEGSFTVLKGGSLYLINQSIAFYNASGTLFNMGNVLIKQITANTTQNFGYYGYESALFKEVASSDGGYFSFDHSVDILKSKALQGGTIQSVYTIK